MTIDHDSAWSSWTLIVIILHCSDHWPLWSLNNMTLDNNVHGILLLILPLTIMTIMTIIIIDQWDSFPVWPLTSKTLNHYDHWPVRLLNIITIAQYFPLWPLLIITLYSYDRYCPWPFWPLTPMTIDHHFLCNIVRLGYLMVKIYIWQGNFEEIALNLEKWLRPWCDIQGHFHFQVQDYQQISKKKF